MALRFVIAAFAFAVASSAWAKSGCYVSRAATIPDSVCPAAENYIGYCVIVDRAHMPTDNQANVQCKPAQWFSCTASTASCSAWALNTKTRKKVEDVVLAVTPAVNSALTETPPTDPNSHSGDATRGLGDNLTSLPTASVTDDTSVTRSDRVNKMKGLDYGGQTGSGKKGDKDYQPSHSAIHIGAPNDPAVRQDPDVQRTYGLAKDACADDNSTDSCRKAMVAYQGALDDSNDKADAMKAKMKEVDDDQARADRDGDRPTKGAKDDDDDCSLSGKLQTNMKCGSTRRMIKANEMTNTIGQVAGTLATQVTGTQAASAAQQAGTQSAALRAGATTTGETGKMQMLLGMTNAMMGFFSMKAGMKHEGYANTIKKDFQRTSTPGAVGSGLYSVNQQVRNEQAAKAGTQMTNESWVNNGKTLSDTAMRSTDIDEMNQMRSYHTRRVNNLTSSVQNAQGNYDACRAQGQPAACGALKTQVDKYTELRAQAIRTAESDMSATGRSISTKAQNEQRAVADAAKNAGMLAMLQGATQMGQGILNMKAAGQLEDAAKQMETTENSVTLAPPGQDAFPATDPRSPTVITGTGAPPADQSPAQDQTPKDDGSQPLGGGIPGPTDNSPQGQAPTPGKFVPGSGGGPLAAGGGIGGLNGGSTQAPGPDNTDKGPTAANPYVSGTTPVSGGGMMGPPPGGAKEASLNPADMMAAALGLLKPQEKDPNTQAYAGGRSPASQGGLGGGLGLPEEDIFKIVEGGYRRQIKAGNIGG